MRRIAIVACAAAVASTLSALPAAAQGSNFAMSSGPEQPKPAAGWVFTPSLLYQGAWDDNVLLRGTGDEAPSDFVNLVNPHADLSYQGRRSQFDTLYDGGFAMYRELDTLNSYDQHLRVSARRMVTPHFALFVQNGFAAVPTTELLNLVAVPFIRHGSKLDDLRGGVDAALSKYTSLTAAYHVEWISFDSNGTINPFLLGGHSQGGTLAVKHALTDTTSLIGNYDLQHAIVTTGATFDVQNADVGVEHRLSDLTRVFGSFGFSRLGVSEQGPARTGPAWRAGFSHQFEAASVDASYSRSFVPAFGFGGTYQNEEFGAHVRAPIARRVYATGSLAWRRNEPLTIGALKLKSFWVEGTVGYALQTWARLEAFYSGDHQTIEQPGAIYNRNRIGFQVVTTKPLRVR